MAEYTVDTRAMTEFLAGLLNTPSLTGFHEQAIAYCEKAFARFPLVQSQTRKGALVAIWESDAASPYGPMARLIAEYLLKG